MLDFNIKTMARIVAAEVFEIEAGLVTPYKMTEGTLVSTSAVMVKLTDADGVEGWGEANPYDVFTGGTASDAARALRDTLLPIVMASPAPAPGSIDEELDAQLTGHLSAKGAVTMALLDILGKRLNVPAATLLGGALRKSLPVLWPLSNGTADEDIRVIDERMVQGFSSFMLKMGTSPIRSEIGRVAELEARYGSAITLIADANEGWTRAEAREFLDGVSGSRLAFVEQPLIKSDLEGAAMLARDSRIPISADEAVAGLSHSAELARAGAANIFSVKSSKNGGPLRAQRIAAVAEAFGIRCYMNSMIEFGVTQAASLQHAVTIGNLVDVGHAFMSTLRLTDDPTDFSTFVRNGVVHLPERAGLGMEVDEPHVRRMTSNGFELRAPA
ncbi:MULTISPECIES: enolase C-terminal domain-like protein [unclassified Burkholderia]|uniref:enolase C-terminal domain-like protein n=1 Tax=unclassified Burkholderia TaxID=2613784 RepID=UPI000F573EEA|nr:MULTISPECIES: enolase C-terminal domain-like protein [unclassified Burkholderia]RQR69851.1 mandelate racemase [Burkholderia sp. Bp9012]RQR73347.1 mandelate racemase [Burkholderia sp. Bp9011]RQR85203.1 mandelate racemase [Burkholderia sp. Bp9010]RQZ40328.1 mandelate racemase [Burkholderia sp. Bp9099]